MRFELDDNEFVASELVRYLNHEYGGFHKETVFTLLSISNYCAAGMIPTLYGGNRIIWTIYHELDDLKIIRVLGLSRKALYRLIRPDPDVERENNQAYKDWLEEKRRRLLKKKKPHRKNVFKDFKFRPNHD